jgi:hypothetical protein
MFVRLISNIFYVKTYLECRTYVKTLNSREPWDFKLSVYTCLVVAASQHIWCAINMEDVIHLGLLVRCILLPRNDLVVSNNLTIVSRLISL